MSASRRFALGIVAAVIAALIVMMAAQAIKREMIPITQSTALVTPAPVLFGGPSEERDSIVAFEARRAGMDPALAIAVSHVENWSGDSAAVHPRSSATGLMQVMPFWADSFPVECYGPGDLTVRSRNACIGTRIAMRYFRQCGNWNCALVWYVGARCTAGDAPLRCGRKTVAGTAYVLAVVTRFGRTDLSPARDAMAYGSWRSVVTAGNTGSTQPARNPRLESHSLVDDTTRRRARDPGAPLLATRVAP